MLRSCLVATTMLAIALGSALAQAPPPGPPMVIDASSDASTQRTSDGNGVITDHPQARTGETIVPATDDRMTKAAGTTTIR